jgi:hypothetical protein
MWFCFRCGIGGDAIKLAELALGIDFKASLSWLGIDASNPFIPDPVAVRKRVNERDKWDEMLQRQADLREEFRLRGRIEIIGINYLSDNQDSEIGWKLLSAAYMGQPLEAIEAELDRLLEAIPREAYRSQR